MAAGIEMFESRLDNLEKVVKERLENLENEVSQIVTILNSFAA